MLSQNVANQLVVKRSFDMKGRQLEDYSHNYRYAQEMVADMRNRMSLFVLWSRLSSKEGRGCNAYRGHGHIKVDGLCAAG
ncbi:hypothetical protein H5410_039457 [Solanum commersonii]|uniref:Uncharacterized protein n=1 Tax=Solanum commersonii TaxID=4109 RepID=A0A9J5XN93_SOLCO|nr:hypothetical protein H5410_039457 [Solanum commersonii]